MSMFTCTETGSVIVTEPLLLLGLAQFNEGRVSHRGPAGESEPSLCASSSWGCCVGYQPGRPWWQPLSVGTGMCVALFIVQVATLAVLASILWSRVVTSPPAYSVSSPTLSWTLIPWAPWPPLTITWRWSHCWNNKQKYRSFLNASGEHAT